MSRRGKPARVLVDINVARGCLFDIKVGTGVQSVNTYRLRATRRMRGPGSNSHTPVPNLR